MRLAFGLFILVFALVAVPMESYAKEKKDCSCPKVTCGPCQKKISIGKIVKFCDWGDINVCRKVVCENVSFYFGCLSKLKEKNKTEKEKPEGDLELVYETDGAQPKKKKKAKRSIASPGTIKRDDNIHLETEGRVETNNESRNIPGKEYSDLITGHVEKADKSLKIFHRGQTSSLSQKAPLFVGDEILNPSDRESKMKLNFEQGSVEISLAPKSKLLIEDPHSIVGRFQPFLYLVHGACEFSVNFQSGSFDLLAGQILTRTPAGKQKVSYEMDQEGLKVKVESLSHKVEVIKAHDLASPPLVVNAGNFVSWVSETPKNLFTMDEKQALAGQGFITPVFQMPESQRKVLGLVAEDKGPQFADWSQNKQKNTGREVASVGSMSTDLCQAPAAQFQQCAWACEGNSKGAKSCEAQKDDVHCVRRVCNAAGQWGSATAFATSYRDLCPPEGIRVGDCTP